MNFVPSDLFVGHGFSLQQMHLVSWNGKPAMQLVRSLWQLDVIAHLH